ncbi:MAG: hypothetical protein ABIE70_02835 [bacterium]
MSNNPRRHISALRPALVAIGLVLVLIASGSAVTWHKGDAMQLSNLHRLDDDLFAMASTVVIDGYIDGDLMSFANDVTHNGEITGSVNVWAYHYLQNGKVGGAVRAGGYNVTVDGYVGRSVIAFGNEVRLGSRAMVRRELLMRGNHLTVAGMVMGAADLAGSRVEITGQIDGDVQIKAEKIRILPPAIIKGNLIYNSEADLDIDSLGGVTILGSVSRRVSEVQPEDEKSTLGRDIILTLSKMAAAFLLGIILIQLFERYARQSCRQLRTRPSVATAAGFLAMLISLFSVVVLLMSGLLLIVGYSMVSGENAVIGSILAIFSIIMIPLTSFASVTGGVLFYAGKITIAMLLGYLIVRLFKKQPAVLSKTQLLVGLIALTALVSLPYLGIVLYILASIVGAGAIVLGVRHCRPEAVQSDRAVDSPGNSIGPPGQ